LLAELFSYLIPLIFQGYRNTLPTVELTLGIYVIMKYALLALKIIKTTRIVIMKLSLNYPYRSVYEKCLT